VEKAWSVSQLGYVEGAICREKEECEYENGMKVKACSHDEHVLAVSIPSVFPTERGKFPHPPHTRAFVNTTQTSTSQRRRPRQREARARKRTRGGRRTDMAPSTTAPAQDARLGAHLHRPPTLIPRSLSLSLLCRLGADIVVSSSCPGPAPDPHPCAALSCKYMSPTTPRTAPTPHPHCCIARCLSDALATRHALRTAHRW
jgi:hypothetical protein